MNNLDQNSLDNIAESIDGLQKKIDEYGKLSDVEKLKKKDEYDMLVQERNKYDDILKSYWDMIEDNKKVSVDITCDLSELYGKVDNIKMNLEVNNNTIEDLISYHNELCQIKTQIDNHTGKNSQLSINYL